MTDREGTPDMYHSCAQARAVKLVGARPRDTTDPA